MTDQLLTREAYQELEDAEEWGADLSPVDFKRMKEYEAQLLKVKRPDREQMEKRAQAIVDDILVHEALIVLNSDEEKVKAMRNWTPRQIEANFALRESSVKRILALIDEKEGE